MFLRSSRLVWALLLSCCFVASVVASASAAPGDIDRSFGQEGVTSIDPESSAYVSPEDMAIGPAGEIYVLRSAFTCALSPCDTEQLVSRYLPNGLSDASFGKAGVRPVLGSKVVYPYFRSGSLATSTTAGSWSPRLRTAS